MSANEENQPRESDSKPGPLQILGSVLSAATGVQNSKNRERDFKHGHIGVFIVAGVIGTVIFISAVYAVVHIVLKSAGH